MAIIKWEPFIDVERFFEDFPVSSLKEIGTDLAVDVYDEGSNIIAKMNVPGVDPEKINVTVEDNMLRVSGAHEEEKEEKRRRNITTTKRLEKVHSRESSRFRN